MKKIGIISTLILFIFSGTAAALTITDLYGDKDGFNQGWVDGTTFPTWPAPTITQESDDVGTITDYGYLYSDQTWTHTYDISIFDTITSASLEVMTYAQGWLGESRIYVDSVLIGTLTDGDTTNEAGSSDLNMVRLDTFDLTSLLGLIDGGNVLRIDTVQAGDWWALDYSELTIVGESAPVPEPGTMLLLGVGLAGLVGYRRFKKTN